MKKTIKNIIKTFKIVFLVTYFSAVAITSTMLLTRNDYGYSQINNKVYIKITEETATPAYKEGSLVLVEKKEIRDLINGEEVFIYSPNYGENKVDIVISKILNINLEEKNSYITIEETNTSWGEDYIIGTKSKSYNNIGRILNFLETKWVFFILLILPCFFILIYEIYVLINTIKYDDKIDEEETLQIINNIKNNRPIDEREDKIEQLTKELEDLKEEVKRLSEEE